VYNKGKRIKSCSIGNKRGNNKPECAREAAKLGGKRVSQKKQGKSEGNGKRSGQTKRESLDTSRRKNKSNNYNRLPANEGDDLKEKALQGLSSKVKLAEPVRAGLRT